MSDLNFPNHRPPVRSADRAVRQAIQHGQTARAKKPAHPKRRKKTRVIPLLVIMTFALFVLVVERFLIFLKDEALKVISDVTTEVGSPVTLDSFFTEKAAVDSQVKCNLDFATVNYQVPQDIHFTITMYYRNYPCTLHVVDTTAPTGEAIPQTFFSVDEVPEAKDCVTNIVDATDVSVTWKETPDITSGGTLYFDALLTDACGNSSAVEVPFTVTKDTTAPVITGTQDLEMYEGDTIAYKTGVTVTDNYDDAPVLEVNADEVDLNVPGEYSVTYIATDFSGNQSTADIMLTVKEKPSTYVEPEVVEEAALEVLELITTDDMTDMEKALAICYWCRYNINYSENADVTSRTRASYDGLVNRAGTCYTFAYAAKALYDAAGIENMIVERYPYTYEPHYWNYICIDGEWYHCDSTPRHEYGSYFFMYTTEELQDIWLNNWNGYSFDETLYPESATESVQDMIDYPNHKVKED